jgi:hypothetical protein
VVKGETNAGKGVCQWSSFENTKKSKCDEPRGELQGNTTIEYNLALGGNGGAASCNKKGGGTGGDGGNGYGGGVYVAAGTADISKTTLSQNTPKG